MTDYDIKTSVEEIDRGKWNDFVHNHPNGNIFQTPDYYDTLKSQVNIKPISVFLTRNNNEILGILIGEQLFENKFYSQFTKRVVFRGGPLLQCNSKELSTIILEEYKNLFGSKVIYSEFRPVGNITVFPNFNFSNLVPEKRFNVLFDLTESEEELKGKLHSTRRRQINRGYKRGLKLNIFEPGDEILIKNCYTILLNLYRKIRLPLPSLSFFLSARTYLGNYLKTFTVSLNEELVGFRFVLCYKYLIYDWYAASKEEHYDKYPNDILPWEIIKWGANNGYKYFDFGGAGVPGKEYGVREYKLKFGGKLIITSRYKIVHKPLLFKTGKFALKLLRK